MAALRRVEEQRYLDQLMMFIHVNPVAAGLFAVRDNVVTSVCRPRSRMAMTKPEWR